MRFCSANKRALLTASILVSALLLCLAPDSQAIERLRVTVGDTVGFPGQEDSKVTVFLTNTQDQIKAFTLHLVLNRNDIANFQTKDTTVIDTTFWKEWCCTEYSGTVCVDSAKDTCAVDYPELEGYDFFVVDTVDVNAGNFDTVGTLISGWEMVEARSVSSGELGLDIKVTAYADRPTIPGYHAPISPQQDGVLFRLNADIFNIPPEMTDRSVAISIQTIPNADFAFSTPVGDAIGWVPQAVEHYNYYECLNPEPPPGTGCYTWKKVQESECVDGCDSVLIDTVWVSVLDSTQVRLFDGEILVLGYQCGDCNVSGGEPTIGDVMLLIDHLFITGTPIVPLSVCNTNCSTEDPMELSIGDVSALIDRLFITGTPMCCE